MQLLEASSAAEYLRQRGAVSPDEKIIVRELAGGVSNIVLHVGREQGRGEDFVLKQARGQLRVEQPWFCSVERIWREVDVLRVCADTLANTTTPARRASEGSTPNPLLTRRAGVSVPAILFEDRDNYAFAMTAAPLGHRTWKTDLLAGTFDPTIAVACGELLGRLHAGTWQNAELAERLGDRTFFIDLRVDPYYRHVASVHEDLRQQIEQLIASLDANPRCLVHGDFSPKNLLLWEDGDGQTHVMLVDCEVGHFGDPAFDLGFFLTHLVLKSIYHADNVPPQSSSDGSLALAQGFLDAYDRVACENISEREYDMLQQRAIQNLAGCLLARVDGKSPVEYLTDPMKQEAVRRIARELFGETSAMWDEVWNSINRSIHKLRSF